MNGKYIYEVFTRDEWISPVTETERGFVRANTYPTALRRARKLFGDRVKVREISSTRFRYRWEDIRTRYENARLVLNSANWYTVEGSE